MDTNETHTDTITRAVRAAFADTNCTIGPFEVKAIVDALWKAQTEQTMRALISETRD